jgi:HD superfamily phosphohydrolase
VVDTPEFQRLRSLHQLGATHYVYVGATHTRFEHSIGVSHLAGELLGKLQHKQPELGIDARDIALVRMAGLCHDIGHGPFSHAYQRIADVLRPELGWEHEHMSQRILDHMFETHGLHDKCRLDTADLQTVKDLINGEPASGEMREKRFLFDIVANHRNGVDTDKFDYLIRDSYNLALKLPFDADRLLSFSRVIGDEVCYYYKEAYNLYEMYHSRYTLHKKGLCAPSFFFFFFFSWSHIQPYSTGNFRTPVSLLPF